MNTENLAIRAKNFELKIKQKTLSSILTIHSLFSLTVRYTSQFFEWQTMN